MLWALLASGVARKSLTPEVKASAACADAAFEAIWAQLRIDAAQIGRGEDTLSSPLWSGAPPDWFTAADTEMRAIWDAEGSDRWGFWSRWWDWVLSGKQLDWDLQRRVALIPEDIWKQGPDAVAAQIREIESEWRREQEAIAKLSAVIRENPLAWRIDFDHAKVKFTASAVEARDMSDVIKDVKSLIDDFHKRCKAIRAANFGKPVQIAFKPVIDLLRRDMRRYPDQPYTLFKAIEASKSEMETIARADGYFGESYVTRFLSGLEGCAEDICLASPEIVEQLKRKSDLRYDLWSAERKRTLITSAFGLHLDSDGMLKRAAFEALAVISDPSSSEDARKGAWYFMTAALPRAARAFIIDKAEAGEGSKPNKVILAKRLIEAADAANKLDKGIDALQENVPELAHWVKEFIDGMGGTLS